MLLVKISLK